MTLFWGCAELLFNQTFFICSWKRGRREFELSGVENDEKINTLEKALEEASAIASEADKKYDEESRRYAIMEMTLEAVEDKADDCET